MSDNADLTPEFDPNEPRKIETAVKVYLEWDHEAKRWVVDPISMDGYPLDCPYEGVGMEFYDEGRPLTGEDHEAFALAQEANLPTGDELINLMIGAATDRQEDAAYAENERRNAEDETLRAQSRAAILALITPLGDES